MSMVYQIVTDRIIEAFERCAAPWRFPRNLASGKSVSFKQLFTLIKRVSDKPLKSVSVPRDRPQTDQGVDVSKLKKAWPKALTSLEDGLELTWLAELESLKESNV